MGLADSLGQKGKTPAKSYKDLFHMNNNNGGVDSTLRTVFDGAGNETPLSMSQTKLAANCGDGVISRPQIKNTSWTWLEHTSVSGTNYTVSCLGGNFHKITLNGNLTNLVISDVPDSVTENLVGDLTLLIDAQNTYTITNWPTTTLWQVGVKPDFSTHANNGVLLVRLLTFDGGTTWIGYVLAYNLRAAP